MDAASKGGVQKNGCSTVMWKPDNLLAPTEFFQSPQLNLGDPDISIGNSNFFANRQE